jgi:hypothetical protein
VGLQDAPLPSSREAAQAKALPVLLSLTFLVPTLLLLPLPCCWVTLQDALLPSSREAAQAEALRAVAGWSWGIEDAIRSTPLDALSRSRVSDRWTIGGVGRGSVTLVGEGAGGVCWRLLTSTAGVVVCGWLIHI